MSADQEQQARAHWAGWVAIAISLGGMLIGVGGYRQIAEEHDREISALRQELAAHEHLDGHPIELAQVGVIAREQRDDRAVLERVVDKLDKLDRNIVALCVRTPGAQCER